MYAAQHTKDTSMPRVTDEIIELNRQASALFSSPDARLARKLYRSRFGTKIIACKCMDGRLNLAVMTKTPPGIIEPFRSMGGKFSLGSPWFGDLVDEAVNYALKDGCHTALFLTYHFSRSNNAHLGCKGWGYDKEGALAAARMLVEQVEHVYGKEHALVVPLVVGIETDEDGLVFHNGDKSLDVGAMTCPPEELAEKFRALYPKMHPNVRKDLFELVKGNAEHVCDVRAKNRAPIDMDHRENVIAVGRGFDWLHVPNRALIVGPFSHQWPLEVATAGKIVLSNLKEGRINPENGVLLLCSSAFRRDRGTGMERPRSELRARDMATVARAALAEHVPDLSFDVIVGTVDMDTRELHTLEVS
jgi:hypothetical protein